ncbi:hypothetical protein HYX11_02195 [Candidatus Woesearchaeota archaeon]|nr:hypothetical protein [Candidatus Woesearchaeota archaeon]
MSKNTMEQYAVNEYINHFKELNEEDLYYLNFLKRRQAQKKHWVRE